jgi:RNA polymerase sigma factor (sigma-70 family)
MENKKAKFSFLFEKYYNSLLNYSFKIVKDKEVCEDLVQETLIKLWEKIETIQPENRSIESYLIVTLKNKIIDNHRKNQSRRKHNELHRLFFDIETEINSEWELSQKIETIYTTLHKKTLDIFQLSRDKGFTYKEIAMHKKISIKTVELHISRALNAFRQGLKDYL